MKRFAPLAFFALFLAPGAFAQSYTLTQISAQKLYDTARLPLNGTIVVTLTDSTNTPVTYTPQGGSPSTATFTANVVNGSIQLVTGFQPFTVPAAATTSPAGIVYRIQTKNQSGTVVWTFPNTPINQQYYSLDGYIAQAAQAISGSGAPTVPRCAGGSQYTDTTAPTVPWACTILTQPDNTTVWTQNPSQSPQCPGMAIAYPLIGNPYCLSPAQAFLLPGYVLGNNSATPAMAQPIVQSGGGGSTPAPPAFAIQFANTTASALQADPYITVNPTGHILGVGTGQVAGQIQVNGGCAVTCATLTSADGVTWSMGQNLSVTGSISAVAATFSGALNGTTANLTGAFVGTTANFSSTLTGTSANFSGTVSAPTIGGRRYAAQWQTGGGNNGIANAAALNQMVISDPSYATTEQPGPFSFTTTLHYQDLRQGQQADVFTNPTSNTLFNINVYPMNPGGAGRATACIFWLLPATWSGSSTGQGCENMGMISNTPGWSFGNPSGFGAGVANGWQSSNSLLLTDTVRGAGIAQSLTIFRTKTGKGDDAPVIVDMFGSGGQTAPSDEGNKAIRADVNEDTGSFTATCNSGCTTGSTLIHTSVANGSQGVGRYAIQTTGGASYTGKITAISGTAVTVDATVPVSNAWGTLATAVSTPVNTQPPFSTSETFNVNITGGTAFDTTHLACFDGNFHEQAIPTAVGTPSGGVQSVTIPLRAPHINGSHIYQGGTCGYGLEETSYTFNSLRYLFDVVGSTGTNTLIVVAFIYGGSNAAVSSHIADTFNATNTFACTDSGGTLPNCSGRYANTGNLGGGSPQVYSGSTFVTAGFSDSALNGNCTGSAWTIDASGNKNFTCTKTGVVGTHTSSTSGTVGLGINGFNLWPMAEVIDVQNETLSPPQADGTLALEPNIIPFATGNSVNETHHYSSTWSGIGAGMFPLNPYATSVSGLGALFAGKGASGGAASTGSNAMISVNNTEPSTSYVGYGGILTPLNGINIAGSYNIGIDFGGAPQQNQALIYVQPDGTQTNNPVYSFSALQLGGRTGAFSLSFTPFSGNGLLSVPGNMQVNGTAGLHLTGNGSTATTTASYFLDGSMITGGTGTTTLPYFLMQPVAAGSVTNWSTAGTVIGFNPHNAFTGNFIDFRATTGGSSVFSVDSTGAIIAPGASTFGTGSTAVTQATTDNSTKIATDAFVKATAASIRAGTWSISSATSVAVTFSTAMSSAPASCALTATADPTTTGALWETSLGTTGFTVNTHTSGTISGTYQCVLNGAN